MKRRTIYIAIFIAFSLCLVACGSSQNDDANLPQEILAGTEASEQKKAESGLGRENPDHDAVRKSRDFEQCH